MFSHANNNSPKFFYVIYHVDNDIVPPDAQAFMANRRPTPFAERVFENIYAHKINKEQILEEIENGKIYFSIIDSERDPLPDDALPLYDFTAEERARIAKESRHILRSIVRKNAWNALKQLLSSIHFDSSSITTILFLMLVFFTRASQANNNELTQEQIDNFANADNSLTPLQNSLPHLIENEVETQSMSELITNPKTHINKNINNYPPLNPENRERFIRDAIRHDNLDKFIYALSQGYDIRKKNKEGKYSFVKAAEYNSVNIIHYVATTLKIDLNYFQPVDTAVDTEKLTESMFIKAHFHDSLLRNLVKWGYNPDYIIDTNSQQSLLHMLAAITDEKLFVFMNKIIAIGADINLQDKHGYRPVFIAALHNNVKAIKIFLENKCITEMEDTSYHKKYNLLSMAVINSSPNTIKFLLENGFDPDINAFGSSHFDANINYPVMSLIIRDDLKLAKLLFKYAKEKLTLESTIYLISNSLVQNKNPRLAWFFIQQSPIDPDVIFKKIFPNTRRVIGKSLHDEYFDKLAKWCVYKKHSLIENDEGREYVRMKLNKEIEELDIPQYVSICEEYTADLVSLIWNLKRQYSRLGSGLLYLISSSSNILTGTASLILALIYAYRAYNILNARLEEQAQNKIRAIHQEYSEKVKDKLTRKNDIIKPRTEKFHKKSVTEDRLDRLKAHCRDEKKVFLDETACLHLSNQLGAYLSYKQVKIDIDCRSLQIKLNDYIKDLHTLALELKREFNHSQSLIGKPGMLLLTSLQDKLDALQDPRDTELNVIENQLICISNARINLRKLNKQAIDLIENICDTRDAIESFMLELTHSSKTSNTSTHHYVKKVKTPEKEKKVAKNEPVKTSAPKLKKQAMISNMNTKSKNVCNAYQFFTNTDNRKSKVETHALMTDECIIYANQLKLLIQNIINDRKMDNRHTLYSQDAILYLLMKSSHLIANLASRFNTIVILPSKNDLYFLRNNIVHYPEICLEKMDIWAFIEKYYEIFNQILASLASTGASLTININELHDICPFIMKDNRYNDEANSENHNLTLCLKEIDSLCNHSYHYYQISKELAFAHKYELEGLLHAAIHANILRFREKLKILNRLDHKLFEKINNLLPELIEKGDLIAHKLIDEDALDLPLSQRLSYAREDIFCMTLMDILKSICLKRESILFIIEDFFFDNGINNLSQHSMKM